MNEPVHDSRSAAPDNSNPVLPFDDVEIETETLPDGRQIHYYRWPEPETPADDV